MRYHLTIAGIALTLAGCGAQQDNSICTPITEPQKPRDAAESITLQSDPGWQVDRADACVHRQAYRLANSKDPAETVAKAVIESCGSEIMDVIPFVGLDERDVGSNPSRWVVDARTAEVITLYEKRALSKVVEGRAGKCRG